MRDVMTLLDEFNVAGVFGPDPFTGPAIEQAGKPNLDGYVYLVSAGNYWKIGFTRLPDKRVAQLNTASPFDVRVELIIWSRLARTMERVLHEDYAQYRVKGEWFRFSDSVVEHVQMDMRSWIGS